MEVFGRRPCRRHATQSSGLDRKIKPRAASMQARSEQSLRIDLVSDVLVAGSFGRVIGQQPNRATVSLRYLPLNRQGGERQQWVGSTRRRPAAFGSRNSTGRFPAMNSKRGRSRGDPEQSFAHEPQSGPSMPMGNGIQRARRAPAATFSTWV